MTAQIQIGERRHIGDGVYASWDGFHLVLQASGGTVFLDSWVREAVHDLVHVIDNYSEESQDGEN